MPWNEPGGDNRDPWSGGSRGGGGGGGKPPNLDEWLRKLNNWISSLLRGSRQGGGDDGGGGRSGSLLGGSGPLLVVGVLVVVWIASGFYIVGAGERGVVTRFGAYAGDTTGPGPHWHLPYPIESASVVDVDQIRSAQHKALMLTQDENIVDVDMSAQYRVKNPEEYLFDVRGPDLTLNQVMESAMREVVGRNKMDFIIGPGRAQIAVDVEKLMQQILDSYKTGLDVVKVNLQDAQPPEQVQGAFADAIKAREDEVRFRNEADAYANTVIPQARGQATRVKQEAEAYKDQVIARAEGDASRFTDLLKEYQKAPRVTRERLYLDAIQSVLSNSTKVMVDLKGGNNLMYLPLDKLLSGQSLSETGKTSDSGAGSSASQSSSNGGSQSQPTPLTTRSRSDRSR
ncbi:MAG: FtsH protease activity modulator HflK [Gammaproteobacteria bacterium]|jgi:membrane protease subunit HflK